MESVRNRKEVGELALGVLISVRLREQGPTQGRWKLWMSKEEKQWEVDKENTPHPPCCEIKFTHSEVVGSTGRVTITKDTNSAAGGASGLLVGQSFQEDSTPLFGHHCLDDDCADLCRDICRLLNDESPVSQCWILYLSFSNAFHSHVTAHAQMGLSPGSWIWKHYYDYKDGDFTTLKMAGIKQ